MTINLLEDRPGELTFLLDALDGGTRGGDFPLKSVFGETFLDAADGTGGRYVRYFEPEGSIRAAVQITHGMAEHGARYDAFMMAMAEQGFACYVMDHAGHGQSLQSADEAGSFGKSGMRGAIADMRKLTGWIRARTHGAPLILYGHSMGSFMARAYLAEDASAIAGAIFSGTGGKNAAVGLGILISRVESVRLGPMGRSRLMDKLLFGGFNRPFAPNRTKFDWLSRDNAVVDRYIADPLCGFIFTSEGYTELLRLNREVSSPGWATRVPKELPMLFLGGERDPVGAMGRGVRQVADWLKDTGHDKVKVLLFPEARHEVLNEINGGEVFKAVAAWIESAVFH